MRSKICGKPLMELSDLVHAILSGNLLAARQWVADAQRARLPWNGFVRPSGLDEREMAVAAGITEMLAARAGTRAPDWTAAIGAPQEPVILDPGLEAMPRTLERTKREAPEALRKRNMYASPDFLDVR
jgi:hypothetical protein